MTDDLISRQAAIDVVNTALFPKINTAKDAEKALKALPSAEPEIRCVAQINFSKDDLAELVNEKVAEIKAAEPQRWTPIEDRPPKFGEKVLISYMGGVDTDWLTQCEGVAYFFVSGVAIQDIDAWMPLPEPYKWGDSSC